MAKVKSEKSAPRKSRAKAIPYRVAIVRYSKVKAKGDTTIGAKSLRSRIRSNAGKPNTATAKWLKSHNKTNRDGNRYPDSMPVSVARENGVPLS